MMSGVYRFDLGAFECAILSDGEDEVRLEELFPSVSPESLDEACQQSGHPGGAQVMGYLNLLVKTGQHTLLVDAGLPDGALVERLDAMGVTPADIDVIYITHADGDHIGGLVNADGSLRYPNARLVTWEGLWDLWSTGSADASSPGRARFGEVILPLIRSRWEPVAPETEFLPGISVVEGQGHQAEHSALWITSGGKSLLHAADAFIHPLQTIHQDWATPWDMLPEAAARTRARLAQRAAGADALVFVAHFPFPGLGKFGADGAGWQEDRYYSASS